jgi:hypothetical protein
MLRVLDEKFGRDYFGLGDVFGDLRSSIALEVSRNTLKSYTDLQRSLYQTYKPLISSLGQWGIKVPSDLRTTIRRVLSEETEHLVAGILAHEKEIPRPCPAWNFTDFYYRAHMARLHGLLGEAKSWGSSLRLGSISEELGQALVQSAEKLIATFEQCESGRVFRLVSVCDVLDARPEGWKLQTLYFQFVRKANERPELTAKIGDFENLLKELDRMLFCRFSRLYHVPAPGDREQTANSMAVPDVGQHGSD